MGQSRLIQAEAVPLYGKLARRSARQSSELRQRLLGTDSAWKQRVKELQAKSPGPAGGALGAGQEAGLQRQTAFLRAAFGGIKAALQECVPRVEFEAYWEKDGYVEDAARRLVHLRDGLARQGADGEAAAAAAPGEVLSAEAPRAPLVHIVASYPPEGVVPRLNSGIYCKALALFSAASVEVFGDRPPGIISNLLFAGLEGGVGSESHVIGRYSSVATSDELLEALLWVALAVVDMLQYLNPWLAQFGVGWGQVVLQATRSSDDVDLRGAVCYGGGGCYVPELFCSAEHGRPRFLAFVAAPHPQNGADVAGLQACCNMERIAAAHGWSGPPGTRHPRVSLSRHVLDIYITVLAGFASTCLQQGWAVPLSSQAAISWGVFGTVDAGRLRSAAAICNDPAVRRLAGLEGKPGKSHFHQDEALVVYEAYRLARERLGPEAGPTKIAEEMLPLIPRELAERYPDILSAAGLQRKPGASFVPLPRWVRDNTKKQELLVPGAAMLQQVPVGLQPLEKFEESCEQELCWVQLQPVVGEPFHLCQLAEVNTGTRSARFIVLSSGSEVFVHEVDGEAFGQPSGIYKSVDHTLELAAGVPVPQPQLQAQGPAAPLESADVHHVDLDALLPEPVRENRALRDELDSLRRRMQEQQMQLDEPRAECGRQGCVQMEVDEPSGSISGAAAAAGSSPDHALRGSSEFNAAGSLAGSRAAAAAACPSPLSSATPTGGDATQAEADMQALLEGVLALEEWRPDEQQPPARSDEVDMQALLEGVLEMEVWEPGK